MLDRTDERVLEEAGIDFDHQRQLAEDAGAGWLVTIIVAGAVDGDTIVANRSVAEDAVEALAENLREEELADTWQVRANEVYLPDTGPFEATGYGTPITISSWKDEDESDQEDPQIVCERCGRDELVVTTTIHETQEVVRWAETEDGFVPDELGEVVNRESEDSLLVYCGYCGQESAPAAAS